MTDPRPVTGAHDHDAERGHSHDHEHDAAHDHDHGDGLMASLGHLIRPHSHDPAAARDSVLESSAAGLRAIRLSLAALLVTAALQAVVFVISGSVALLADTIHNLSDALTALPLGLAFILGRRPPSRRFTYGLGRAEDLAGLVVVLMIGGSAVVAAWESARRFADPRPVSHLLAVALAGLVGFAGNELVAVYRIRVGRRIGSAALVADGLHARADGLTSLGVVLGAAGVAAGWQQADPVVGLAITVAILIALVGAVRDVGHRLLDGVDPAAVARAETILSSVPGVVSVEEVRLRWVGHELRGEAVIAVRADLDVTTAHDIAHSAEDALRAGLERLQEVTVHVGPPAAT